MNTSTGSVSYLMREMSDKLNNKIGETRNFLFPKKSLVLF